MIAFSKTAVLTGVATLVLLLFVVNLASANEDATPRPTYCTKTSDCGPPSTHQDCVNGTCGCIIGYTWDNNVFDCTGKNIVNRYSLSTNFFLIFLQWDTARRLTTVNTGGQIQFAPTPTRECVSAVKSFTWTSPRKLVSLVHPVPLNRFKVCWCWSSLLSVPPFFYKCFDLQFN